MEILINVAIRDSQQMEKYSLDRQILD
jgi:hypothetical protein